MLKWVFYLHTECHKITHPPPPTCVTSVMNGPLGIGSLLSGLFRWLRSIASMGFKGGKPVLANPMVQKLGNTVSFKKRCTKQSQSFTIQRLVDS